jgi:hypothetical protein
MVTEAARPADIRRNEQAMTSTGSFMKASPFFPESLAPIRQYEGTAYGMLDILVARLALTAQRKRNGLTPAEFALGVAGRVRVSPLHCFLAHCPGSVGSPTGRRY